MVSWIYVVYLLLKLGLVALILVSYIGIINSKIALLNLRCFLVLILETYFHLLIGK